MSPFHIIEEIFSAFATSGHRHYGESVTELQHALQCALLATQNNEDPAMIVACLLHDYGHLRHHLGEKSALAGIDARHELIGASELAERFPEAVTEPIRLHVEAKRYLCHREPGYFDTLSEASVLSLELQGGVMNEPEAGVFELLPHSRAAIRLRRYDDGAKVADLPVPGLESYRRLLESMVVTR